MVIEARELAGLSQRDVCKRLKRPSNFAHLVESGERMISTIEFPDYAEALGLTAAELMNRMLELERSSKPIGPRADARKNNGRKRK